MDNYQREFLETLEGVSYTDMNQNEVQFDIVVELFRKIRENKGKLFFVGNGGSAAIANHMTADFLKNGHMRTVNLFEAPLITCLGNDYGYEYIFSKSLEKLLEKDDLLVTISSSGNSKNIVNAIISAREAKANIVTLSGFHPDNKIRSMGDYNIYVPKCHYGVVESVHNLLLQEIVDII